MIGSKDTQYDLNIKPVKAQNLLSIFITTPSAPIILNERREPHTSPLRNKFELFWQQLILNSPPASHRSTFRMQLQTDQYSVLSTITKLGDKEEKSLPVHPSQRKRAMAFHCLLLLLLLLGFFLAGELHQP